MDRQGIDRDEDHPKKWTQFRHATRTLGVELILAYSLRAKGRVERRNAVFQDQLVKELRLRNISDMNHANALLEKEFLAGLNKRFAVEARRETDLHRVLPLDMNLGEILL